MELSKQILEKKVMGVKPSYETAYAFERKPIRILKGYRKAEVKVKDIAKRFKPVLNKNNNVSVELKDNKIIFKEFDINRVFDLPVRSFEVNLSNVK